MLSSERLILKVFQGGDPLLLKNNNNNGNEQLTVGMQVARQTGALVCLIFWRNAITKDKNTLKLFQELKTLYGENNYFNK